MKRTSSSRRVAVAFGCTFLLCTHAVLADITLKEQVSVKGAGLMSFANMSGTSTTVISDDKARMQSELKMESRLARMVAAGVGNTAEIVRLDQGKLYQLDLKERRYDEISLADQRARIDAAMAEAQSAQQEQPMPVDETQCDWSEPVTKVTRGGKATIAGYDSEQLKIAASQSCTDRSTGEVCEFTISLEQWLAPEFSGDATAFYRAYAEQMGLDVTGSSAFAQRAEALLGRYSELWSEIAAKTGDVEGYPLKSQFALAIGGPQCTQGSGDGGAGVTAGDVGESVLGGLGGRVAGSLLKRRKKAEPEPAPSAESAMTQLLAVSTELLSVSLDPVDSGEFEVPSDFTRMNAGN
jgi:hypothetical protein